MTIATPEIEASVLSAVRSAQMQDAQLRAAGQIRTDAFSPVAIAGQRAMVRSAVMQTALIAERVGQQPRVDSTRLNDIAHNMMDALGLRVVDDRIDGMEARADSYYMPGELIARDTNPIRVKDQRRAVQESVNSRNIDPGMEIYESNAIDYEGSAKLAKPGDTVVPSADYNVGSKKRLVYSLITSTHIDWMAALYGAASSVNGPAEKAEAADRALRRVFESILVTGFPGTDLESLFGTEAVAVAKHHSTLRLDADATTLGQIYSELMAAVQAIPEANNDRGGMADTALMAPAIIRAISRKNNIDDGGSLTGADLYMALEAASRGLGQAFSNMGITAVQPAPALNAVPGAAGTETNRAGVAFYERGNSDGLRRVIALAPSPVRTAEELLGTRTLWALRTGGLECPDATSVGIATFRVRT